MADKETKLSIVLRTVDKATAGLKAINDRLDKITKPIRDFKDALGDLREKSGLDDVAKAFGGVGDAIGGLLSKVAMIGGLVGVAVAGVFHLIGGFDDLGDRAEAMGVSVDFLASMRYAAERSGVEVGKLDEGLKAFTSSVGQAKAGTGRMAAFLGKVSPALLRSVKASKSTGEAFDLIADAAAKIVDPTKRAAFAQKTLGDASLAPLLARGGEGVKALRDRYIELAGSQEEAAGAAGTTDDSLKDLHAATDGVKAALVSGLAPALTEIVKQLTEWLRGHRADVKEWAAAIGKQLPAAFAALVDTVKSAIDFIKPFVDSGTKIKIILIALAAVMVGPLISAFVSLGIAIMTTPVGWIMAAIAALIAIVYEIYKHWDGIKAFFAKVWDGTKAVFSAFFTWLGNLFLNYTPAGLIIKHWSAISDFFSGLWDGVKAAFQAAWDFIKSIVDKVIDAVDTVVNGVKTLGGSIGEDGQVGAFLTGKGGDMSAKSSAIAAGGSSSTTAKVVVDFANAPRGTRAKVDPQSSGDVDLSMGYQMGLSP